MLDHSDIANAACDLLAGLAGSSLAAEQQATLCDLLHNLGYEAPAYLTAEQVAEYMEDSGRCPYCKSEDISGGSIVVDTDYASQVVDCANCGAQWYDEYTRAGVAPSCMPEK